MFSRLIGGLLIAVIAILFVKYRPKAFASYLVWGLCAATGFLSLIVGGGSVWLQAAQITLEWVMVACCVVVLQRERVAERRKEQHRINSRRKAGRVARQNKPNAKENLLMNLLQSVVLKTK